MRPTTPLLLATLTTVAAAAQTNLFRDGFERGDLTAWSRAAGAVGCTAGPPATGLLAGDLGPAPAGSYEEVACLEVRNDRPIARGGELAFAGVPMPPGPPLTTTAGLTLVGPGERRLAAQLGVLARWGGPLDDVRLPIRWLQVALPATVAAGGTTRVSLRRHTALPPPNDPFAATITAQGALYAVDTGLATFLLDPANPALFAAISIDLDDDGLGRVPIYAHTGGAGPRLVFDAGGTDVTLGTAVPGAVAVDAGGFRIVERGPVKVVVALDGHFSAPGGASLCDPAGLAYERFGYTLVATLVRGSRDLRLELHFRNECSDAFSGPWTDQAVTVRRASWELPLSLDAATAYYAGGGAVAASAPGFTGTLVVEQRPGGGTPWRRRARVLLDGVPVESGEAYERPLVALADAQLVAAAQMAWMRYREPQALAAAGSTLSLRLVGDSLLVGEGKGIWGLAKVTLTPAVQALSAGSIAGSLEALRDRGRAELERGLLVRAARGHVDRSRLFPSLGTDSPSTVKAAYLAVLGQLHDQTVSPGGQWDRAKTFGSQLWPDVQYDLWLIDNPDPAADSGAMNYWNPTGVELFELLRSGDPKWAWDFALPESWLQLFTAYLNLGDHHHGDRGGFAVTSGGSGIGQWHRSAFGSDDYSYNQGMALAYLLRPSVAVRDRFAQAGRTVVERYDLPRAMEAFRERFVNQVDLTRQVVQHFEMLADCAEFVPGAQGQACHDRLQEVLAELAADNLRAGLLCQGDVPSATLCSTPQQFMQNALMVPFLDRMLRNYGDPTGNLQRALVEGAWNLYAYGIDKGPDGASLAVDGDWAAALDCSLTDGGTTVASCAAAPDSDGNLAMYAPTRPQTAALLLLAHDLDPTVGFCSLVRAAYDDPALTDGWQEFLGNDSGWWKAAAQMLQGMVFGVGLYDSCEDP